MDFALFQVIAPRLGGVQPHFTCARPDALEIQDIVQFYFVLLGRIEKHIAAKSAVAIVD